MQCCGHGFSITWTWIRPESKSVEGYHTAGGRQPSLDPEAQSKQDRGDQGDK